jgi:sigma-E factor negative regulatory protein RseB
MGSPYSMQSSVINGPIPTGFFRPYDNISAAYNVVSVGGGRITDRAAQHIRVVARDQQRYGYSIWLDRETGMLLRSATLSVEGDVLEQVQLTSLFISDEFPPNLSELEDVARPPLVDDSSNRSPVQGNWTLNWLPDGFKLVRSNHHQMAVTGAQADYFLYSDGLAEFSVYISDRSASRGPLQINGPDSLFSTELGNHRVTVIGRLPFATVQRIARGVQGQP